MKEYRRVPLTQLRRRLQVEDYEGETPFQNVDCRPSAVRIKLRQHAGQAAVAVVEAGKKVRKGQLIGRVDEAKLGANIHSSIDGKVRAVIRVQRNALLVPQAAVSEQQGSYLVMVLRADSTVHAQPVVVGPQVDSSLIIERGLEPGALVIVEGTQVVREGVKVAARPYGLPAPADTQRSVRVSKAPAATRP